MVNSSRSIPSQLFAAVVAIVLPKLNPFLIFPFSPSLSIFPQHMYYQLNVCNSLNIYTFPPNSALFPNLCAGRPAFILQRNIRRQEPILNFSRSLNTFSTSSRLKPSPVSFFYCASAPKLQTVLRKRTNSASKSISGVSKM